MPTHNHGVDDPGHTHSYNDPLNGGYEGLDHDDNGTTVEYARSSRSGSSHTGITIDNKGGGSAHNNMPPYIVLNYIIKY